MTQRQLNHAVARRTGEPLRTVHRLGFSALADGPAAPHPEALYLVIDCPRCRRHAPYPGQRPDGTCLLAHCPSCDASFAFDLLDVFVAASPRDWRPKPPRLTPTPGPSGALPRAPDFDPKDTPAMITITRRQARRLRAVFRRHPLGITHKGAVPPLVFRSDADSEVRVRHQQPSLAVEHLLPGSGGREEAIALPLDALADFEGGDNTPVVLEAAAADRTIVRWDDHGIPQRREYAVPDLAGLPPFPTPPAVVESCPGDLLDALAEAAATTDEDSTRYALGCLQWNGATGQVIATDGRQVLIQGGFRVPWDGELLVRRTPLFSVRELPRDRPVAVGRTDTHVMLRAGSYTLWLAIRKRCPIPARRAGDPLGAGRGHPAPARPRGRAVPGPGTGSAARRRHSQRPAYA